MLAVFLDNPTYTALITLSALLLVMFLNRNQTNIVHLCCALISIKLIEKFAFMFIPLTAPEGEPIVWVNNTIYLTHLFFDIVLLFMLMYRGFLSRFVYSKLNKPTKGLHLTFADIGLFSIAVLFILVDLYATLENLIRNMEHLGIPEDFAKRFWEVDWMFYNYSDIKRWLMGAQFLVIWTMISRMAKREFKFQG